MTETFSPADDEVGRRYYCNLAFNLAAQFSAALLEASSSLIEDSVLQQAELSGQAEDGECLPESETENSPGSDQSPSSKTEEDPDMSTSCTKPGTPREGGTLTGSCTDSDSHSQPSQVSDDTTNRSGSSDCTHPETNLADLSPALLQVLDALSLLLPAVRVWFDWLVLQRELWLQFVSAAQKSLL